MLELILFLLITSTAAAAAAAGDREIALPGCPDHCGGVEIPFPFGTQPGCFYNSSASQDLYSISCDNSTGNPTPILTHQTRSDENRSVIAIDLNNHTLRVSNQVAYACYQAGKPVSNFTRNIYSFDAAPFASSPKNKLVAVGCDTTARVGDNDRTAAYFTGCMTSCLSADDVTDGACSGIGCCEASIPEGIYMPYVNVGSFDNHVSVEGFNPCSFAFVSDQGGDYNFSTKVLNYSGSEYPDVRVSALLDWALYGPGNCTNLNTSGNLLCGMNTDCVDVVMVGPAYRCACSKGFSGNPYLTHGCQDIDECADAKLNECEEPASCLNKAGGYSCTCPPGYFGVGTPTRQCFDLYDPTGRLQVQVTKPSLFLADRETSTERLQW